jgi:hypothetical protein
VDSFPRCDLDTFPQLLNESLPVRYNRGHAEVCLITNTSSGGNVVSGDRSEYSQWASGTEITNFKEFTFIYSFCILLNNLMRC